MIHSTSRPSNTWARASIIVPSSTSRGWWYRGLLSSISWILPAWGRLYCNLCTTVSNWLIGYHMCTHIAKSLNTQCKAIQNAVKSYNEVALHMSPPCPTLDWENASHYVFLKDFQLLYNTQQDIHHKQWSNPVVWVAMKQKQWIDHAWEEIENYIVEILCLHTHLLNETFAL